MAPFLKVLRRTSRVLGEVRDLDVFRDKVRTYLETLPDGQRCGLDGFLMELKSQHTVARQRLLAHLDCRDYRRFVTGFAGFVGSPGMGSRACGLRDGEPEPYRVRHVAPMAIMERLAAVRAYGECLASPGVPLTRLHALRIATKRLRYALEFFAEVLGPQSKGLIRKTVALQDHLGLLQDGVIASGILRDFLVWGSWGRAVEGKRLRSTIRPVIAPGVATYLAMRQSEIQQLLAGFPAVWACITDPDFSRGVAAAIGQL
jgi:CHAD domain-containing protein